MTTTTTTTTTTTSGDGDDDGDDDDEYDDDELLFGSRFVPFIVPRVMAKFEGDISFGDRDSYHKLGVAIIQDLMAAPPVKLMSKLVTPERDPFQRRSASRRQCLGHWSVPQEQCH